MIKPRVLVITFGSVLQPQGGWAVRARAVLDALHDLGVSSVVISTQEPGGDAPQGAANVAESIRVLRTPLVYGWSKELADLCRELLPTVDGVIVESALFLPAVLWGRPRVPIIWDTNECETLHYMRMPRTPMNRLKGFVWKRIERWVSRRSDVVVAISHAEAEWWRRLFTEVEGKIAIVDHRQIANPVSRAEARAISEGLCGGPLQGTVLTFAGAMMAKHNAAAADWILHELAPSLPEDCTLLMVGPGSEHLTPTPETKARVYCLGEVPDVDPVVAAADFGLAPLPFGAGVKTKVLHYLAHGKRVIGTPIAFEAIEDAPGIFTGSMEELKDMTLRCLTLAESPEEEEARSKLQRDWLDAHNGRQKVADQWAGVLQIARIR